LGLPGSPVERIFNELPAAVEKPLAAFQPIEDRHNPASGSFFAELIVSVDFITQKKLMTCLLDSQAALVKLSNPFVRWRSPNRLMIPWPISR